MGTGYSLRKVITKEPGETGHVIKSQRLYGCIFRIGPIAKPRLTTARMNPLVSTVLVHTKYFIKKNT